MPALGAIADMPSFDHPLGHITGRNFLEFRVFDTTLHAWDMAGALGTDEDGHLTAVVTAMDAALLGGGISWLAVSVRSRSHANRQLGSTK